ncbi:MAG: class I SAM-dependent methyltransferase [Gemmataceae bacterium]|nr:class I SAM-dependent methyltransferase [Gemmataceae bacterium]
MDVSREVTACRICGNTRLDSILDLGNQALTGVFPRGDAAAQSGPIELIKCSETAGGCGLVQLRHSYAADLIYGSNYGYRSGLNASMVAHLRKRVRLASERARPQPGDLILDIGSNDGTTLGAYPANNLTLVGMDPSGGKFAHYYPAQVRLIPDFFSPAAFAQAFPGRRAKIVTSFAMFYDLDRPQDFMAEVHAVLADDGIWVLEQSYCPAMLRALAYDTICHEHVSYYALRQIKWMADRVGFKIVEVEHNDINGGSFCVTLAKTAAAGTAAGPASDDTVARLLDEEDRLGLGTLAPFLAFRDRVFRHRAELQRFVRGARRLGRSVYGYGASTKGNVLLQFCGFTADDIPAIAEVNEDKFGAFTPGTRIPILSEREVHALAPDYLLVLPWHFRANIIQRESAFLARGGQLVFPLPRIQTLAGYQTLGA